MPEDLSALTGQRAGPKESSKLIVHTSKDLTPGEKLKASFGGFAHDGKSFFVSSNERDQRFFQIGQQFGLIFRDDDA